MNVEIRAATKTEMDDYRRVATTALMISPDILSPEVIQAIRPDMTLCAFEDGKLATAYAWWPLKMYFNGGVVPVSGITFVGTRPVYRRRGHLRRVVKQHFEMLHESKGQPIAVLIASQAAIYQRYGYGIVATRNSYEVEPRHLLFAQQDNGTTRAGKLRELDEGQIDLLSDLYQAFCKDRTGYLYRGKAWWEAGPLRRPGRNATLCNIVYEEDSKPLGYVIYTIESRKVAHGQPWQRISIRDFAWLTSPAYRALWHHFSCLDLAGSIGCQSVSVDDPLPHLLLEPRKLNIGASDGFLARVVDVARAIPHRQYDEAGILNFELQDELCPWNTGRWQLETADGNADIQPTSKNPEAVMPVDTLAMLLFGQITPTEAARMGRMEVCNDQALTKWDRVMQTRYKPFCPDFF